MFSLIAAHIVVGDYNARIGSDLESDEWLDVCGVHGFGGRNSSGIELLSFAAVNQFCIRNTTFPKHGIFMRTWQHPGSLHWHCIDYITVCKYGRSFCTDACVVCGAECGSDHHLLYLHFEMPQKIRCVQPTISTSEKYCHIAIGKLFSREDDLPADTIHPARF